MSFILEALKKSEKNRQENSVPTLETLHEKAEQQPRKRALWPLLLMMVLIVNAGVLLWLFGPWQSDEQTVVVEQPTAAITPAPTVASIAAPQATAVRAADVAVATTQAVAPQAAKPKAITVTAAVEAPVVVQQNVAAPITPVSPVAPIAPAAPVVTTPPVVSVAPQPAPVAPITIEPVKPQPLPTVDAPTPPAPVAVAAQPVAAPEPITLKPVEPSAMAIGDLPINIQNQLPRLHMSVHAYNGNANSLIRLNNKIMREGSLLDSRYRLEEITTDGAIFSYQGYRFLVPRRGL